MPLSERDHERLARKTIGKDGFDDAVIQLGAIEHAIGIDNAALTALPPPTP